MERERVNDLLLFVTSNDVDDGDDRVVIFVLFVSVSMDDDVMIFVVLVVVVLTFLNKSENESSNCFVVLLELFEPKVIDELDEMLLLFVVAVDEVVVILVVAGVSVKFSNNDRFDVDTEDDDDELVLDGFVFEGFVADLYGIVGRGGGIMGA